MARKRTGGTIRTSQMTSDSALLALEDAYCVTDESLRSVEFDRESFDWEGNRVIEPNIRVNGQPLEEVVHLGEDLEEIFTADTRVFPLLVLDSRAPKQGIVVVSVSSLGPMRMDELSGRCWRTHYSHDRQKLIDRRLRRLKHFRRQIAI